MKKILFTILLIFLLAFSGCARVDFKYTIDFVVDGKIVASVGTDSETIAMPKNPTKDGYTFGGWFWDDGEWNKEFTLASIADQPLQEENNYKVYAKWLDENEQVEQHKHSYTEEVVEPTCSKKGCTIHRCECGDSYIDCYVDALAHNYSNGACISCGQKKPSDGISYTLSSDQTFYKVSGIGTATGDDIVIAKYYGGLPVKEIAYSAFNEQALVSIYIPDSVTTIDYYAFQKCYFLENITFPNSLTEISNNAFSECVSLESVVIPDNVITLGDYAFSDCTSLKSVKIGNGVKALGANLFNNCTALKDVTLPASLESIGIGAFSDCSSLVNVSIPNTVTKIGAYAFNDCEKLENVNIPSGVTVIDDYTFHNCYELKEIILPNGLTEIVTSSFNGCTSLKDLVVPDKVVKIKYGAFQNCYELTSITLGKKVKIIENFVFMFCNSLQEIVYKGTKAEWNIISKEQYWNSNSSDFVIRCTDGEIPSA